MSIWKKFKQWRNYRKTRNARVTDFPIWYSQKHEFFMDVSIFDGRVKVSVTNNLEAEVHLYHALWVKFYRIYDKNQDIFRVYLTHDQWNELRRKFLIIPDNF